MEPRGEPVSRSPFGHPAGSARRLEAGARESAVVRVVGAGSERVISALLGRIDARLTARPGGRQITLVVVADADEGSVADARQHSGDAPVLALIPACSDGLDPLSLYAAGAAVVCGPEAPDLLAARVRALLRRTGWKRLDRPT